MKEARWQEEKEALHRLKADKAAAAQRAAAAARDEEAAAAQRQRNEKREADRQRRAAAAAARKQARLDALKLEFALPAASDSLRDAFAHAHKLDTDSARAPASTTSRGGAAPPLRWSFANKFIDEDGSAALGLLLSESDVSELDLDNSQVQELVLSSPPPSLFALPN